MDISYTRIVVWH